MSVGPAARGPAPHPAGPLAGTLADEPRRRRHRAPRPLLRARVWARVAVSGSRGVGEVRRGPSRFERSDSTGAPRVRREAVAHPPACPGCLT